MEGSVAPRDAGEPRAKAGSSSQGDGGAEDSNSKKKPNPTGTNRKRTKTGCLTCRKRRIKCDEGRPTCNNCIKSKRSCEGYNQRVVFKQNIGADPYSGSFAPFGYIHGAPHPLSQIASQQARSSGRGPLPTIAPRPPAFDYHHPPHGFQYEVPYPATVQGATHSAPPGFDFGPGSFPAPSSDAFAHPPPPPQPNPLISANLPGSYGQHAPQFHSHDLPFVGQPEYYTLEQTPPSTQYSSNLDFPPPDPIPETNLPILPAVQIQHEAYESSDENASMADSDDGEQTSKSLMAPVVLGMQGHDARDVSLRSFSAFARNDALGEYMSSPHASELKDHAKRKLFEHFLRVTGPTMSLYERHPFDPAEREMANHISEGRSNIWSYTFPVISFHHPALLHAILAMSSLQVSKLQQNPATAAIKHYHIALRRVAKNVQAPLKRLQPATLAATLLLAYFEVWNSEHNKWCSHLYGARTLFAEIPLRQKARSCLPAKSLRDRQRVMRRMGLAGIGAPLPGDPNALDFDLLTTITGYHVTAADYGLREDQIFQNANSTTTEKEIETFENLRDLFWWYCKMDIYQSMLGGTKLFMEYEHWTQCPPRAPAAKLDGIFGTYDHLMLLLGRLASFASNDMARKRKSSRSKGSAPGGNSPPFAGMFPAETTVRPPMGFSPPKTTESHDDDEGIDPQESYKAALHEWSGIQHAFEVFEGYLGSEFRHLSPEYSDRRDEPFGPALQYRTYSVAGIWMNYYMGLIHLHRSHPDMPPTAMQSVGLSARKTVVFANQIGRIAVGLSDDTSRMTEVSTVLAAALVESAFCLFVAAVQFQDGTQRDWVVRRMHDITRLTAWQSARQIANGCESYWTKAAQFGRGPPYVRPADLDDRDSSIWNSPRRIDRRIQEVDQTAGPERRVVLARADRAHYALGLLGVEDDLEYLELKDDTFNREGEDEDEGGDA